MKSVLDSLDTTAIVIGSGLPLAHRLATRWLRLPWPVVRDPDRGVYRAFGLTRALGLIQASGTFIIDPDGIVRYANAGLNPGNALYEEETVATLRRMTGSG
jgi:peroxiredoxin